MGFGYSYHNQIIVGYAPANTYPGTRTHRLDSDVEWSAFSFIAPPGGATLNKVLVYVSGVAGAPLTDAKLQCEVYTDTAGVPDTSLATTTTVTAKPAAAAWVEFTGFTLALTGGALYWVVLKNIEANPTTKYPIYRYITNGTPRLTSNQLGVFSAKMTGDSGTTWNTDVSNMIAGWRLEFSDGFSGYPLSDASSGSASYAVYENREQGAYFTTPARGQLVVAGAIANVKIQGSPGNGIKFRLYKGTTLVDTSKEILDHNMSSTVQTMAMFTAQRVLDANTVYRLTIMHSGAAGTSSNYYTLCYGVLHDSADSRALGPLKGWQNTYTTDSTGTPPSFSETATIVPCIALLLDTDGGEIYAAGGGGLMAHNGMTGGVNG